jgi:hypothetical protein
MLDRFRKRMRGRQRFPAGDVEENAGRTTLDA